MSTPSTTARLLFEEEPSAQNDKDLGNWTVKTVNVRSNGRPSPRMKNNSERRHNIWLYFVVALVMLLLGILIGHFVLGQFEAKCENDDRDYVPTPSLLEQVNQDCGSDFPWKQIRLPNDLMPLSYKLKIHPNLTTLTLKGHVDIHIQILERTDIIVMHALKLNLTNFHLWVGPQLVTAKNKTCNRLALWVFQLDQDVTPTDRLKISIDFTGLIHKDLSGLYVNTHHNNDKTQTLSAITQFEPTQARKAFPCFDEPNFKATFELSIVRDPDHLAIANMNQVGQEKEDEYVVDKFAESVKMSTYLLAFAVLDDFRKVRRMTKNTKNPIEVNLYASRESIKDQAEFGLETGVRALEFFEDFFDLPFPLQKTDMVALDDFAEGAMENWGLITFRDAALLYNQNGSTERTKEHIALVVCHEMAHQWFGNYVTMQWWNDLWLNEGFANFMEYLCVDHLYPSWKMIDVLFAENFIQSMQLDGFHSSHAISTPVEDPAQIGSIFDAISYQKGAAIIRMLRGLAGNEPFQKALQKYLQKFAYANAQSSDLWEILQQHMKLSVDVSVTEMAEAWTTQVGYPMVSVSLTNRSTFTIHNQRKFIFLEEARYPNETQQWPIPIQYQTDRSKELELAWLEADQQEVHIELDRPARWLIANTQSLGYYRVLYDAASYTEFINQLTIDHKKISTIDRAMLINDAFSFLKSGHLGVETVLNLIQYVKEGDEEDRIPWAVLINSLKSIENMLADSPSFGLFQTFERSLILKTYEKMGWSRPRSHVDRMLQTDILAFACRLQIADCTKNAVLKFNQWVKNKNSIFVDIQPFVIEEGIRRGTVSDWERVYNEYMKTIVPAQKLILLSALAATTDVQLIQRFLNMLLDPNIIRPNVVPKAFAMLMQNKAANLHAWRFLRRNYEKFDKMLGSTTTLLGFAIKSVLENFNTQFDLDESHSFFKNKEVLAFFSFGGGYSA
uniref:Aminopeptidase n=1 Tax=Acrobeloides nanus TaxID=290746 RepID=A0A914CAV0_9BILA